MTEDQIILTFLKAAPLPIDPGVLIGPGLDAAVLRMKGDWVVSTDMSVEGTHFDFRYMTPESAGWRAVVLAAPDVIALGAPPEFVWLSVALPKDAPASLVRGLAKGAGEAMSACGAVLLGGDTTRGPCVVIDVTVAGRRKKALDPLLCQPGDCLALTGPLGGSAAALAALQAGQKTNAKAYRFPQPDFSLVMPLFKDRAVVAMTDISDGLIRECSLLAQWAGLAVELNKAALPAAKGAKPEHVLHGGEDGVLLAACRNRLPKGLIPIGRFVEGPPEVWLIPPEGKRKKARPRGFEHF